MLVGNINDAKQFIADNPNMAEAIKYLQSSDLEALQTGIHKIDGDRLYVNMVRADGLGEKAVLETHERYADVHFTISGQERIGFRDKANCKQSRNGYHREKDYELFDDNIEKWVPVPSGAFAVFFPEDAHAPLGGNGSIHKAVVKVLMENNSNKA